jgi:Fic family protein
MPFAPKFSITTKVASDLMRMEAARSTVQHLPITSSVLAGLRETARLLSTHYSTMIEGNQLTQEQVSTVIEEKQHFPGRGRDEKEVLGYYAALEKMEQLVVANSAVTENHIQTLHALVMAEGRKKVKPSPYRDGQNVIRDSRSRRIVYMPPEAKDVPQLMKEMVAWIARTERAELPCPIRAAIAHYQFATIHPYYDGNGRTARLLTTLILHLGGFDLKGLYSLEEYYARNLGAYYEALTIGPSHNYYGGRAKADITKWVEYFCGGAADSFEAVQQRAAEAAGRGATDRTPLLRRLDPRQRKALELFRESESITSRDVASMFSISERAARNLLSAWVADGFFVVVDAARKSRRYGLSSDFQSIID